MSESELADTAIVQDPEQDQDIILPTPANTSDITNSAFAPYKPPKPRNIVVDDLKDSLGDFGVAKVVGAKTTVVWTNNPSLYSSNRTIQLLLFIPADYYNVFWVDEIEKVFFPSTVLICTLNPHAPTPTIDFGPYEMVNAGINTIYMSPDNSPDVLKNIFQVAGWANTSYGSSCCPALYLYSEKVVSINNQQLVNQNVKDIWDTSLDLAKALWDQDLDGVKKAFLHPSLTTCINALLKGYTSTGFNNDHGQEGWPLGPLTDYMKEELKLITAPAGALKKVSSEYLRKTAVLKKYLTLSPDEILALPKCGHVTSYDKKIGTML